MIYDKSKIESSMYGASETCHYLAFDLCAWALFSLDEVALEAGAFRM